MAVLSWTQANMFDKCPHQWQLIYRDKGAVKRPTSPQMQRGIRIHSQVEKFIERSRAANRFDPRDVVEAKVAKDVPWILDVDSVELELSTYADSGFRTASNRRFPGAAWMGKVDAVARHEGRTIVIDWKTGKKYPDVHRQLELYALLFATSLRCSPESIRAQAVYLDQPCEPVNGNLSQGFEEARSWAREIRDRIESGRKQRTDLPKKPGPLCPWCPAHRSNGGPCDG